jgi:hypothetical protein
VTSLHAAAPRGLMALAVAFPAGSLRGKLEIPLGDGGKRGDDIDGAARSVYNDTLPPPALFAIARFAIVLRRGS